MVRTDAHQVARVGNRVSRRDRSLDRRRRLAALRAPRAHDELGRRAGARRASPRTTSAPATTSSRSPTTGASQRRAVDRPSLLVVPSVELNCMLPGDRDGHVLGFGRRCERGAPRARRGATPTSPATADWIDGAGGVAYLAHPYWTGVHPGDARAARRPSSGSRCSTRAASSRSGAGYRPSTGTSSLESGRLCSGARDRRLAPSGLRLRPRVDVGARRSGRRDAVLDALRTGRVLRLDGPA